MIWSSALSTKPTPDASGTQCAIGLQEFSLSLHPEKTRLIEFGRHAATRRAQRGSANRRPSISWVSPSSAVSPAGEIRRRTKTRRDRMRWRSSRKIKGEMRQTNAPADPRTGALAEANRLRLLQLPRSADELSRTRGLPVPTSRASGGGRFGDAAKRIASRGPGLKKLADDWLPNPASFIPGQTIASPSTTQGGSHMRESCTYGSVRGAPSNGRPYGIPSCRRP